MRRDGPFDPRGGTHAAPSEFPGTRRGSGAGRIGGAFGEAVGLAPDRGHRDRFHPAALEARRSERDLHGSLRRGQGDGPAPRARRSHLRGYLEWGQHRRGAAGGKTARHGRNRGYDHHRFRIAVCQHGRVPDVSMNRRWFLGVSAASALAGLTGSARGASANAALDLLTLAQPDLLSLIGPQAVRKIGLRYRTLVPTEKDRKSVV